ncbi:MAG TPA: amidohydrolase family protein, partial [Jatrophihabitans sp.]|nr:amidohydrolase family protein [Jatrophihabitans sp.]
IERGLASGQHLAGTGGLLQVGPMKVITDGSLNTRTAYCRDPYPGVRDDPYGLLLVPPEQLRSLLRRAAAAGFDCAVHAIGDEANTLALQAFAASGAHGRIEHAQLLATADLPRFAELGVIASVQPAHALDDRAVAERLWAGRTGRAYLARSLLDAGAVLAFGSDAPVAPLDPWLAMAAAVGRGGSEPWHPEQAVSVAEALAASVAHPSRDPVRIEPGMPADLLLCEADPLRCELDVLQRMPVYATLVAGRFSYRADG